MFTLNKRPLRLSFIEDPEAGGGGAPVDPAPTDPPAEPDPIAELTSRLEAQQKVNRDLERKLKGDAGTLRTQVEELQAKLEGREAEFAKAQEKREAEAEALSKANQRILRSEIKAAAAGKLADPTDAFAHLDLSGFEVDDDGGVNEAAIAAAIADLLTRKPYLSAEGGRRFQGGADGGARKEAAPAQLTRADLARLSPEQLVQAEADGRLNDILGIH